MSSFTKIGTQEVDNVYIAGDVRGVYPESYYQNFTTIVGVNAGDILFTSGDVTNFNTFEFQGVANLFTVEVSLDGTVYSGPVALEDGASLTPATRVLASANSTSIYSLRGKFKAFRIKQSGAVAAQARGAYGVT